MPSSEPSLPAFALCKPISSYLLSTDRPDTHPAKYTHSYNLHLTRPAADPTTAHTARERRFLHCPLERDALSPSLLFIALCVLPRARRRRRWWRLQRAPFRHMPLFPPTLAQPDGSRQTRISCLFFCCAAAQKKCLRIEAPSPSPWPITRVIHRTIMKYRDSVIPAG